MNNQIYCNDDNNQEIKIHVCSILTRQMSMLMLLLNLNVINVNVVLIDS